MKDRKKCTEEKDKKCSVNGLEKDTEHNIHGKCVIVGKLQGMWNNVTTLKTKNINIYLTILSKEAEKFLKVSYVNSVEKWILASLQRDTQWLWSK